MANIPAYPGSRADPGKEGDIDGLIKAMAGKRDWFPAETHVYVTGDSPERVLENFNSAMPSKGWKQASKIPGKSWGYVTWSQDNARAQILTGIIDGQTHFILGCSVTTPTPTALPAEKRTFKQAYELLRQRTGLSDLAFFGYEGMSVDEGGKSIQYTVSGYSPGQKRSCYIRGNDKGAEVTCRDQASANGPLVEDVNKLKDSSELAAEIFKKYGSCAGAFNLNINLSQSKAQFLCSASKRGGDVSPFK
jgi:hypothetical protein